MSDRYTPTPENRFVFGLWTVGNPGRDTWGGATRPAIAPDEIVRRLGDLGAYGVCFHDNDLIPFDATAHEREQILSRFRQALDETGLVVSMATTNLAYHPAFKDGSFTANDPAVRRFAYAKSMRAIDLGASVGAKIYVFWGGREGGEIHASKPAQHALERYREAINFLSEYVIDRDYGMRFAMEPKPNEPRGDLFLPTVGHALHFIETLDHPDMVGLNPEVAHETMAGLNFVHAVGHALWAGKLFHIDLNSQRIGRYDQDYRFGQEDIKELLFLVKMLEESGYDGPRHFDAHALRAESADGVWDFARGSMRTYLILKEKAAQMAADPRFVALCEEAQVPGLAQPTVAGGYSAAAAAALLAESHDADALAARVVANERLDQLVTEHLLGVA
jgi:xylose isomerase